MKKVPDRRKSSVGVMKKRRVLAIILSVLMMSSVLTVQAAPSTVTGVGQHGAYTIPVEQKSYPAQNMFYGFNVVYNGQIYADGNEAVEAYKTDCRRYDSVRLLSGTLQRVPVGALINCCDMVDLYGYEALYHHSFNGNEFCVITRDKLMEAVLLMGMQPVADELLTGEVKSEYLQNSGNYSTLDVMMDSAEVY